MLVLFAITATAMLAVIGLLYSFGLILSQRRSLQGAADAASLAGTWQVLSELASDNRCDANVSSAVTKYAATNGATTITAVYVDASNTTLGSVGSLGACQTSGQFPVNARGVNVTVSNSVATILPGFVKYLQVLVQDSATSTARPSVAPAASPVVPIAISVGAYSPHGVYDLFANPPSGGSWATLDLSSAGAPTFAAPSIAAQYWSDGQHLGSWQLAQPATVSLLSGAYYESVAAGLQDNIRRQALPADIGGHTYGLITVAVYDSAGASSVHVVGFAQLKILSSDISATSAKGTFVPYPAAAFGGPGAPVPDLYGATLVGLSS